MTGVQTCALPIYNGTFETYLGTTSVNVYDIDDIPEEGLEYAVLLPVDLNRYRQPCEEGAKIVKIRAIMSWQVPPPSWNPNYIPVWGNREETLVHIKPGQAPAPGSHAPIIQTVGSMNVDDIDNSTGLANGGAALAGFTAVDSPFGGEVVITGHIANAPDISAGATPLKYKIDVRKDGGSWEPVGNSFTLGRDQLLNGVWSSLPTVTQAVDAEGWYEYREDLTNGLGNAQIFPVGNVLARWQTHGLTGLWTIRIQVKEPGSSDPLEECDSVTIRVDSAAPQPSLTIVSGGGACADFTIGDEISGTYEVTDEHFLSLTFRVLPADVDGTPTGGAFTSPTPFPGPSLMPLRRAYDAVDPAGVPTTGEAGTWTLNTAGMPKCGYIIELTASDRTIVNSGFRGRTARDVVGFCLREEEQEA